MEASIQEGDLVLIPQRISAFQYEYNEYLPAIIEESNRLNRVCLLIITLWQSINCGTIFAIC